MAYFGAWVYYLIAGWIIFGKLGINAVLSGFKTACGIIAGWVSMSVSLLSTGSTFLIIGVHALMFDLKSTAASVCFYSWFSGLVSYTKLNC